ncbi:hypothetical protein OS493_001850 [Desmophyllum pertusum]|uniref:Uncharacterized protein n=1 Tax=Desmophyllum pertusum TaxID=174260 RepID=A0A9W9Z750_9CNID|nr:hypothetical protein OS493_001850 [Desmophyllum pertusum]
MRKMDTIRPETFTADQEWFLCRHVVTEATSTVKNRGEQCQRLSTLPTLSAMSRERNGYYLWNIAMIIFLIDVAVIFCFQVCCITELTYYFILDVTGQIRLSGLVFLGCMAIEIAVAAVIPDTEMQKSFDRISLYVAVGVFVIIHIVALVFVVRKSRNRNRNLRESDKLFRERQQLVNKFAKEREQQKLTQERAKEEETSQQDKVLFVEASRSQGGR